MKPSAVLLIDLENFFCSREDFCRKSPHPVYDRQRFKDDLERLLTYARAMTAARAASELPFTVRRAYADFNAVRYVAGGPQHYLRPIPEEVLSQGVEPVQVFRLSRGGKNAADMKMAMDATSLLFTAAHVEHFVLVTGDADFIPVILELKRHGRTVSVIGVTGATSPKLQRFVDNFELFEDLVAAEEVENRTGESAPAAEGIGQVAAAVHRLLARSHPLRFAAVKPLLSKELGHAFDPALFGCDTTGDFLRSHYAELGIVVRQGQHDSEIDLPNGHANGHAKADAKPAKSSAKGAKPAPEPHTPAHYKQLLTNPQGAADREGKVYGVSWAALAWVCDAVVPLLAPPTGAPTASIKLLPRLVAGAETSAVPDIVKNVRLFYPTLRAGLPVQSADGVYSLPADATGESVRASVLRYVAYVLKRRLAASGAEGEARPDQLAAVFEPGAALDQATAEFAAALADAAPPAPEPPAEDVHTAAGYVKLLKIGGARGSETEAFKVLPVPWPSVERVCADAFDVLSPANGGGPLPRDQVAARLIEAGKGLCLEKYDQHVRRVLGILRLAGDICEGDDLVSLGADVVSGYDLRGRALAFLLQLLQLRLEERGVYDPIRVAAFVAALEAGPLADRLTEEVGPAIEWLYRPGDEPGAADAHAEPLAAEPVAAEPPTEPTPTPAVEEWEPYALDDARPQSDAATELRHAVDFAQTPTDQSSGEFGAIDVAALTSEAVAAAEVASAPPTAEVVVEPLAPTDTAVEMVRADPPTAEDIIAATPLTAWLSDGDALFAEIDASELPIALPEPPVPPPPAVGPVDEVRPEVDRMKPPPLPRRTPPPLPPFPPPESA